MMKVQHVFRLMSSRNELSNTEKALKDKTEHVSHIGNISMPLASKSIIR